MDALNAKVVIQEAMSIPAGPKWYAPYLAALITSGGRLLLGMLERCVEGWGGTYAWADTDALGVVSNAEGGTLRQVPGCESRRILPRSQVQEIIDRFAELNPYDFGGSILRFLDCNYIDSDPEKGFRKELLAFCISAKRYTTYERDGKRIMIIDPKAHGLGYLYPPADSPPLLEDDQEIAMWVYEAWEWLVRRGCGLNANPFAIIVQAPANDAYGSDHEQPAERSAPVKTRPPV